MHLRLPVNKMYYRDEFANVIAGLFTRIAPKITSIGTELASNAFGGIRDKGISVVGVLVGSSFNTA